MYPILIYTILTYTLYYTYTILHTIHILHTSRFSRENTRYAYNLYYTMYTHIHSMSTLYTFILIHTLRFKGVLLA